MKPHKLGCINPCGRATIYEGSKPVAMCLDTPVARATAFAAYPQATHALCYTPDAPVERIERHDWTHTMSHAQAQLQAI
jgi:hypothetical protein